MNSTDDRHDDPDADFSEKLLKKTLGAGFNQDILQRVTTAESRLLEHKDWLLEFLDIGVLDSGEFALKANAIMGIYLKEVADIVGEDTCRKMYDYGPQDQMDLIPLVVFREKGFRLTPVILVRTVDDAIQFFGNEVSYKIDEAQFRKGLIEFVRICTSQDLLLDDNLFAGARKAIVCWQAAIMSVFLASTLSGPKAKELIGRVCQLIAASERLSIAFDNSDDDFFRLMPSEPEKLASLLKQLSSNCAGDTNVEQWLGEYMSPMIASKRHEATDS